MPGIEQSSYRVCFVPFGVWKRRGSCLKANQRITAHGSPVAFDRVRFTYVEQLQHQTFERAIDLGDWQRIPALFWTKSSITLDDLADGQVVVAVLKFFDLFS